jgi:hypothetical protein
MSDERRDDDSREAKRASEVPTDGATEGPASDDPPDDPVTAFDEVSLRQGPHAGMVAGVGAPKGVVGESPEGRPADDDPRFLRVEPELATPRLRAALLGDFEGFGLLTIIRGENGAIVESDGTWRAEEGVQQADAVLEALPVGTVATFDGTRVEGRQSGSEEQVRVPVVVRGHGRYRDEDDRPLLLVNFVLAERE